jgi:predicted GIY-YIG superfamily endonuclease
VENNKKPWQSGLAKDMDENNQESHHETKQVEYSEARTKAYKRHGYICYTITNHKRTYVGITNLLQRRLKQHNGILKGGARATRGKGPWFLSFYVHGFRNKSEALSFEWWMHHKKPRFKYIGSTTKRLYCCCQLLSLPKFHHLQVKVIARAPTGVVT